MDESEVRRIVDANIKQMRWALQLQDWDIGFEYKYLDGDAKGECAPDPRYRHVLIGINTAGVETEADVLKTLRHELIHLMNADIETYRKAVGQLLNNEVFNAMDELFKDAVESLVRHVEHMLDHGLKVPMDRMTEP